MSDGHVHKLGDKFLRGSLADQEPDLLEGVGDPREQDQQRNADGTDGVKVPHEAVTNDGHDQAENVHDDIVAVVDEEDVDGRVLPQKEAVDHQGRFCANYAGG
jgi:hypothetical protein